MKKNRKLNYHFYSALRRGFFKPAAWFRGVLFPLCEDPTTTIREAEILASIIVKVAKTLTRNLFLLSIPPFPS